MGWRRRLLGILGMRFEGCCRWELGVVVEKHKLRIMQAQVVELFID